MIHLTMTDQTVMSVPVKSLSRWHKLTHLGVTISSLSTHGLTPIEPKTTAVSVVYLKDGAVLYVMEEAATIDALYKAATNPMDIALAGTTLEPLRKVEGYPLPPVSARQDPIALLESMSESVTIELKMNTDFKWHIKVELLGVIKKKFSGGMYGNAEAAAWAAWGTLREEN